MSQEYVQGSWSGEEYEGILAFANNYNDPAPTSAIAVAPFAALTTSSNFFTPEMSGLIEGFCEAEYQGILGMAYRTLAPVCFLLLPSQAQMNPSLFFPNPLLCRMARRR